MEASHLETEPAMTDAATSIQLPPIDSERLLERFLRYVAINTRALHDSETYPSSPNQRVLGELLVRELLELGLKDAALDAKGYVMASLPGNRPGPRIGFIAHLDTAAETPAEHVQPVVHRNYQGQEILYPRNPSLLLSPATCPSLATAIGHDLVTTDGTTLLGADDKSGIAIIMQALETLQAHPEWPRGELAIAFTPDEEIGQGTRYFDQLRFGATLAYTIDGETAPEFNDENFNAANATLTVKGLNVHPGKAKGIMVNAITLAGEFLTMLPADQTPQTTEGREGFIHPNGITGGVGEASVDVILRDFDVAGLDEKKRLLEDLVARLQRKYPRAGFDLDIRPAYRNMRQYLEAEPQVMELALAAIREAGLEPARTPMRGGTDGAALSRNGVLTPNLFTGSGNHHGLTEWASLQQMTKASEVMIRLARLWTL